jgi:Ca2+-binding EF-hand superfamily protein
MQARALRLAPEAAQMRANVFLVVGIALLCASPAEVPGQQDGRNRAPSGYEPAQYFDKMSGGSPVWLRPATADSKQKFFDRVAQALGITNGQITLRQWLTGQEHIKPALGKKMPTGESFYQYAQREFKRFDLNGDGFLNPDEAPPALRQEFTLWDKNKDGVIDYKEFRSYLQATVRREQNAKIGAKAVANLLKMSEEDRPVVYRAGNLPLDKLPPWFVQLDTDHDGQIGLYEWRRAGKPLHEFQAMDRNNDGFLTVEEILYYQATLARKEAAASNTQLVSNKR